MQLVARPWRDDVALAAAAALERALGGRRTPRPESGATAPAVCDVAP